MVLVSPTPHSFYPPLPSPPPPLPSPSPCNYIRKKMFYTVGVNRRAACDNHNSLWLYNSAQWSRKLAELSQGSEHSLYGIWSAHNSLIILLGTLWVCHCEDSARPCSRIVSELRVFLINMEYRVLCDSAKPISLQPKKFVLVIASYLAAIRKTVGCLLPIIAEQA